jgi:ribosomal protein S18 acetylase RimI-like enzyme
VPELSDVPPGSDRERWVPLLELADEPEPLRAYLHEGELFGLLGDDGAPLAAILVIDDLTDDHSVAELRAVAVAEHAQGQGVGSRMIEAVVQVLAERGVQTVFVGTASSGVRQLAFYQRCGFRLSHVERDFFTEEKRYPPGLTENGIAIRDMVWMDRRVARPQ